MVVGGRPLKKVTSMADKEKKKGEICFSRSRKQHEFMELYMWEPEEAAQVGRAGARP